MLSKLNARIKKLKRLEKSIDTPCAKLAKKVYKYTKFMKQIVLLVLLLLPYFNKPRWCIDMFEGKDEWAYSNCGFNRNGIGIMYKDEYDLN